MAEAAPKNHFFCLNLQNKSFVSMANFKQASYYWKKVPKSAKLAYATKTKEFITSQKFGSHHFYPIANSVLNESKSTFPPLFTGPEVLFSASEKINLLAQIFSEIPSHDDSGISKCAFPPRSNLCLHNIPITYFDLHQPSSSSSVTCDHCD